MRDFLVPNTTFSNQLKWSFKLFKTLNCREQSREAVAINSRRPHTVRLGAGFLLMAVQIGCSVFAGVYNEHLIKNVAGGDVHIMVQGRRRRRDFVFVFTNSPMISLRLYDHLGDKVDEPSPETTGSA